MGWYCGSKPRPLFDVGDRSHWSYLLPKPLRAGSYKLLVHATDGAGNVKALKLRFTVLG